MMADTARGRAAMTPVVTIGTGSDLDADAVDVIHHDVDKTIGGPFDYTSQADSVWWVDMAKQISASAPGVLLTGNFSDGTGPIVGNTDTVKFLCIKHTGLDATGDATSQNVYISLDANADPSVQADSMVVGKDECFMVKPNSGVANNITVDCGSGTVICEVVAVLDDGGAGGGGS